MLKYKDKDKDKKGNRKVFMYNWWEYWEIIKNWDIKNKNTQRLA